MRRKPGAWLSICPLIISFVPLETIGLNSILTYVCAHGVVHRVASIAPAHRGAVSRFILDMLRVKTSFQKIDIAQFANSPLSHFGVLLGFRFWHDRSGRGRGGLVDSGSARGRE